MLRLLNSFKGIAQAHLGGSGDTILFWNDLWNGRVLRLQFPHLHSFAINENLTVKAAMEQDHLQDLFHLPLSEEAYDQFNELDVILQSLQLTGENDSWSYIWGNGQYSSAKAYKHLLVAQVHPAYG
jgi:hypothetical protein